MNRGSAAEGLNMRAVRTVVAGLVLGAGLVAGGCSGSGKAGEAVRSVEPMEGDWQLVEIEGESIGGLIPADGRAPEVRIADDGRISGFAGVNRFSGSLNVSALSDGRFEMGPAATTRMAGPSELMRLEDRFLRTLQGADSARLVDGRLVLRRSGDAVLAFAPAG